MSASRLRGLRPTDRRVGRVSATEGRRRRRRASARAVRAESRSKSKPPNKATRPIGTIDEEDRLPGQAERVGRDQDAAQHLTADISQAEGGAVKRQRRPARRPERARGSRRAPAVPSPSPSGPAGCGRDEDGGDHAVPHSTEAIVKPATPSRNIRLRPNRSPAARRLSGTPHRSPHRPR